MEKYLINQDIAQDKHYKLSNELSNKVTEIY